MSELQSCVVEAMIRGYHEYHSIWEAEVGENLTCIRSPALGIGTTLLDSKFSDEEVYFLSFEQSELDGK